MQPLLSVTVTEYEPAINPFAEAIVEPLLQEYEYGAVPPAAITLAEPVFPPKQRTSVLLHDADKACDG